MSAPIFYIYLSVTRSWSLSGNDGPRQSTVPTDWRVPCRGCIFREDNVDSLWCTHWLRLMSGTVRCILLCPSGFFQILRYDIIRQGERFYHRIAPLLYVLVFIEFQATCPAWPYWVGNTMVIRQSGNGTLIHRVFEWFFHFPARFYNVCVCVWM